MNIGESAMAEVHVEIHPRSYDNKWTAVAGVTVQEGIAYRNFTVSQEFDTKEDAEAYVRENVTNWIQGER